VSGCSAAGHWTVGLDRTPIRSRRSPIAKVGEARRTRPRCNARGSLDVLFQDCREFSVARRTVRSGRTGRNVLSGTNRAAGSRGIRVLESGLCVLGNGRVAGSVALLPAPPARYTRFTYRNSSLSDVRSPIRGSSRWGHERQARSRRVSEPPMARLPGPSVASPERCQSGALPVRSVASPERCQSGALPVPRRGSAFERAGLARIWLRRMCSGREAMSALTSLTAGCANGDWAERDWVERDWVERESGAR
jgi:hypothetical protein